MPLQSLKKKVRMIGMTYAACRVRTNVCKILVRKSFEKQPPNRLFLAKTDGVK